MTETLLIQSVPPGAQTKINGKYSRNTPLDLPDLPLGNIWSIFQFVVIFRHNRTLQSYCWRDETDICGTGPSNPLKTNSQSHVTTIPESLTATMSPDTGPLPSLITITASVIGLIVNGFHFRK